VGGWGVRGYSRVFFLSKRVRGRGSRTHPIKELRTCPSVDVFLPTSSWGGASGNGGTRSSVGHDVMMSIAVRSSLQRTHVFLSTSTSSAFPVSPSVPQESRFFVTNWHASNCCTRAMLWGAPPLPLRKQLLLFGTRGQALGSPPTADFIYTATSPIPTNRA